MRTYLIIGGLLGAAGVILGAFGAHALKEIIGDRISTWKTAQNYHLIHSILILITGYLYGSSGNKRFRSSSILLIIGIVLFSGSLYLLCLVPDWKWLGPITPAGGICFVLGWLMLSYGAYSMRNSNNHLQG